LVEKTLKRGWFWKERDVQQSLQQDSSIAASQRVKNEGQRLFEDKEASLQKLDS
jgi:hypothetical protein